MTVHSSVTARSDFNGAVTGDDLGGTRSRLTFPLASAQINRRGNFLVGFGMSNADAEPRVSVDSPGVYPVEVGIVGTDAEHSTFVTWMVVIDRDVASSSQPLRLSWIWQLASPPVEQPGGAPDPERVAEMHPGGRLDKLAKLLAGAGNFPLTLGIGPETLAGWASAARSQPALQPGVARIRHAAARSSVQLLPEPYVPIAGPTIEAEGLGGHLPDEYVAGSDATEAVTGQIPDPRTALVDPIDDATVSRLKQMLVGRFVVRDSSLAPIPESRTPAQPFSLTTSAGSTPAVATDSGLEFLLASPGPPALQAQRVIAALAEIAYEAPSQARGVVLAMPGDWNPASRRGGDPAAGAEARPAGEARHPRHAVLRGRAGRDRGRRRAPAAAGARVAARRAAHPGQRVRRRPAGARGLHDDRRRRRPDGRGGSAGAAPRAVDRQQPRRRRSRTCDEIQQRLDSLTGGISTTAKTITLTARRASLPLSFQNNTGRANIRVRVHLESPKLIFPKGTDVVMTLPRRATARRQRRRRSP